MSNDTIGSSIYGTATQLVLRSLGEYGQFDLQEFKAIVKSKNKRFDSFSERLFRQMLISYPCQKLRALTDIVASAASHDHLIAAGRVEIPKLKWDSWSEYIKSHDLPDRSNSAQYVEAFLRQQCIGKEKLCKSCDVRRPIIEFFSTVYPELVASRTIERNLSNWLNGSSVPSDRKIYIELCYALNLRLHVKDTPLDKEDHDANHFLCFKCLQNPLYIGDTTEAVHYYTLLRSQDTSRDSVVLYRRSLLLIERIHQLQASCPQPNNKEERYLTQGYSDDIDLIRSEDELVNYLALNVPTDNPYYSARLVLRYFKEDYADFIKAEFENDETRDKRRKNLPRPFSQKESRAILDALTDFDVNAIRELNVVQILKNNSLGAILYSSNLLQPIYDGEKQMSRTILLLTVTALNYALSPSDTVLMPVDDLTETKDFTNFVKLLNTTLLSCSMAPLNPQLPLDYCLIYAYYIMRQDKNAVYLGVPDKTTGEGAMIDSLSIYFGEAISHVVESMAGE